MSPETLQDMAGAVLSQYAKVIEEALAGYIQSSSAPESAVADAMRYSLLGGGKRLRGALVAAFYRLYHDETQPILPFACALEMVHAYSLIHDDLPCMDDDDMRRGKPSCHKAFGEATALLAGDGLLTLAFETMAAAANLAFFPAELVLQSIWCVAYAAGLSGMIGGQAIDLAIGGQAATQTQARAHHDSPAAQSIAARTQTQAQARTATQMQARTATQMQARTAAQSQIATPSLQDRMIMKKTGALIGAAALVGCTLAGAGETDTAAALRYANYLGFAFQIADDILDITGETAILGKPAGSDEAKGKSTYVTVHGLKEARRQVDMLHRQAKEALDDLPGDTSFLRGLVDMLADRQK